MKFTDLPEEVIVCIADFLDRETVLSALFTCRRLLSALQYRLWETVDLDCQEQQDIGISQLQEHAHWVRELKYSGVLPLEFFKIPFPKLQSVEVSFTALRHTYDSPNQRGTTLRESNDQQQENNLIALIHHNPQLQHLYIKPGPRNTTKRLWETVATLPQAKSLKHDFHSINPQALSSFWRTCTHFQEFWISASYLPFSPTLSILTFHHLERLTFCATVHNSPSLNYRTSIGANVDLFRCCPNLKHLHWTLDPLSNDQEMQLFVDALEQSTWPWLEDLTLICFTDPDQVVSTVIQQLPPLKRLQLGARRFAGESFSHLQERLFSSLKSLDLSACLQMTSRMVLDILQQCAPLEELRARHVSLVDIKATPQPWACVGLRQLQVFFVSDPWDLEADKLAFELLARLTYLERLDLSGDKDRASAALSQDPAQELKSRNTLLLRVGQGLEYLSTLRRLKTVLVAKYVLLEVGEEDREWMREHWPMAEVLNHK